MKPILLIITLFTCQFVSGLAKANKLLPLGNGSSGVGNRTELNDHFALNLPKGSIRITQTDQGVKILDGKTEEPLLITKPFQRDQLSSFGNKLIRAKLGEIEGYEYLPLSNEISTTKKNFWIVCPEQGDCLKLEPLSSRNPKVPSAIGSLTK